MTVATNPDVQGGLLFFREDGTAGCPGCGWTGAPTSYEGQRSTFCPSCESPFDREWKEALELEAITGGVKVGRNEPCPCGSGRKWKKCHGAV